MVRSKKRTDDLPDPDRPNLGQPMDGVIFRDPRYVAKAKSVVGLSFACPIERLMDKRNPDQPPITPKALRLLQQREEYEWEGYEKDEYSDGGEADTLRPSVAASDTVIPQLSSTTTTASTQSTTTALTSGCSGPIATPGPTPDMPHTEVMAVVEASRQMCQVPTTTAPEYTNAHVNQPQRYADKTHHGRPGDERGEQVRTMLPIGGENLTGYHPSQPSPHATGNATTQARLARSPRHGWYSGSSSSDEWTPHKPTPHQQRSKSRSSCAREQEEESSRTLQNMKTLMSWRNSFDNDPTPSREEAEESLASIKECMKALEFSDAEVLTATSSVLTDCARAWNQTLSTSQELATRELEGLAVGVAGLDLKANTKGPAPKEPAPPLTSGGKGREWRGGEQNSPGATQSDSAESATATPNTPKPASTAAPKPPTSTPPTPTLSMAP
ncbi:hypothetical protein QAD02_021903 [Eretmocerus hayati]|uniref:Uncharacterized protein n=1 Tax=Eretmocerus hayati TaxID=131215 RepID=A0ACC2PR84_9HYME|nr:hypothetical protein QAD02_021903 [Eretmocerus hayati]